VWAADFQFDATTDPGSAAAMAHGPRILGLTCGDV
jgi:hypothetical protein